MFRLRLLRPRSPLICHPERSEGSASVSFLATHHQPLSCLQSTLTKLIQNKRLYLSLESTLVQKPGGRGPHPSGQTLHLLWILASPEQDLKERPTVARALSTIPTRIAVPRSIATRAYSCSRNTGQVTRITEHRSWNTDYQSPVTNH
jgi:hypothetical protein